MPGTARTTSPRTLTPIFGVRCVISVAVAHCNLRDMATDTLFRAYMALGGTLAAVSVPLYVFVPFGTAQTFSGGDMPPMPREQAWWVQTVAAGDMMVAYMCWVAFWRYKDTALRATIMRGVSLYTVLHMAAFARGAVLAGKSVAPYVASVGMVVGALLAWGDLLPRKAKKDTE